MCRFRSAVGFARPPRRHRRCNFRPTVAGVTEPLERRRLLAGVVVGVTPGSSAAGLTYGTLADDDGGGVMVRDYGTALVIGRPALSAAAEPARAAGGFDIVLNQGPNLASNPAAAAAFEEAAAFFELTFHDPVTVVIDAEIAPLAAGQLGQASSVVFGDTFNTIRDAIVADADPADEAVVAQLPTEVGFLSTLPNGSFSLKGMSGTRANLLALGVDPAELNGQFSQYSGVPNSVRRDSSILFNSNYPFDYDRSDGIGFGLSDFVGVAIHEIGHSLGFVSAVDNVDNTLSGGGTGEVAPMPLDLFRFAPGAGGADFAGGTRVLSPGGVVGDQVLYDGGRFDPSAIASIPGLARGDVPFSTGAFTGDGRQASHWKDESFIGGAANTIGTMDPTATEGARLSWTAADERAFGLIGWDTAPAAVPAGVSGTVYDDLDADGVYEPASEGGLGGVVVYHDLNNNGQFDRGVAEFFGPASELPRPIRDLTLTRSRITIEGTPGTVQDVDVMVNIEHTYTFDLEVTLVSPTGRRVTLFDNVGQEDFLGRSMDFTNTVLDDEAGAGIAEGEPPFTGRYRPQQPLSLMDGETLNGTWTLEIYDWADFDEGQLLDWSLALDSGGGEQGTLSDWDGSYSLTDLPPGTIRLRQIPPDGYRQSEPLGNAPHVFTLADGEQAGGRNFGLTAGGLPAAAVVGRHLFYNGSKFDGADAAADARDDAAIATDKRALRPGGSAQFEHYSTYTRGINGVMVDVANLPPGDGPSAADFDFRAGNDDNPFGWADLALEPSVSVRRGAGVNGSDRVTFTWPAGTVVRQWLQVTTLATVNTGLSSPDVFYFGNLPGEVGDSSVEARVTAADVLRVRGEVGPAGRAVDDLFDFNRDGRVNTLDYAAARTNLGRSLPLLTAPVGGLPAPRPSDLFGTVPVATTRRSAYRPARAWSETEPNLLV